ncbi:MAG: glycosyltransferase family 9 protein [Desulfuromonadales bacterium]|nr:glycosyltransferase family 9 protein [Desulfuromonadales bacterium]
MRFSPRLKNGFMRLSGELFNRLLFLAALVQRFFRKQQDKKRLLLVRTDSIGDFILFSPCLVHYREHFPEYEITLLVSDAVLNLAEMCPHVDSVWSIDKANFQYSWYERYNWYRKIAGHGFDIAINAVYSPHIPSPVECLTGWSVAPKRIAFECLTSRKVYRNNYTLYYTDFVPESGRGIFEMERNFILLRFLGYAGKTETQTTVWTSLIDEKVVSGLLAPLGTTAYAVLFPGAQDQIRIWYGHNYVEAIVSINSKHQLNWIVCGDAGESGLCVDIVKALQNHSINAVSLAGTTSLREAALVIKDAVLYLGSESMGAHLAAAMSVPAVCILGGGHYGRFYPYPENSLTVAVTHKTDCYNCDWICTQKRVSCIENISVEQAVTAMDTLLTEHRCGTQKRPVIVT